MSKTPPIRTVPTKTLETIGPRTFSPSDGGSGRRFSRRIAARTTVAILGATALLGTACGDDSDAVNDGATADSVPVVIATTGIWADVVTNVACDGLARIETIIPPGGDPHSFEPSLADRERMDEADLIVANGLLLEEGLDDTLDAASGAGTPVFRIAEHVDTIAYSSGEHDDHESDDDHANESDDHEGEDEEHDDHTGDDPHVWFDPQRVSAALPELAEYLVDDAGLDEAAVAACVRDYRAELAALDEELAGLVAAIPAEHRRLVTNHEALGYYADRYGFEVVGTVIPAPSGLAETNPAQLEELARLVETTGVGAIFAESQHSTDDAEALAARVGDIEVVTLFTDTLGPAGSGAETYAGLLRTNTGLITAALG